MYRVNADVLELYTYPGQDVSSCPFTISATSHRTVTEIVN